MSTVKMSDRDYDSDLGLGEPLKGLAGFWAYPFQQRVSWGTVGEWVERTVEFAGFGEDDSTSTDSDSTDEMIMKQIEKENMRRYKKLKLYNLVSDSEFDDDFDETKLADVEEALRQLQRDDEDQENNNTVINQENEQLPVQNPIPASWTTVDEWVEQSLRFVRGNIDEMLPFGEEDFYD